MTSLATALWVSAGKLLPKARHIGAPLLAKLQMICPQQQPEALEGVCQASFASTNVPCRRDEEGLPIFSTEELNIGKGGNTGACPFECDCCF